MESVEIASVATQSALRAASESAAPRRPRSAARLALLVAAVLAPVVLLAWAWSNPAWLHAASAVVALTAVAALALALVYRHGLAALHGAIGEARVGNLVPVDAAPWARALLGPVIADYDGLSHDLASLFGQMERAQLAIIGERNQHDAVLQSLPGALLIVDTDLRVIRGNRQAEALFRRPRLALAGAELPALMNTDATGRELLTEAMRNRQPVRNAVCEAVLEGDARRLSLNLTFFDEPGGTGRLSAVVILQDVTDFKRLEELTHQTEKLVAMGQLAGGVAHELNTPLGTILGYAQLLAEGRADEQRRAEYARTIGEEARRCSRIIENLLAYARRPSCEPETSDLNALIGEARDAVANCQGRRLGVTLEAVPGDGVAVRGSAGQLEIVLVNLLVNAVQAATHSTQPTVRVGCEVVGDYAVVAVTDNGPGVPPELRRRIFEPFFTTRADGDGTGLGLALSQSIVTRIGGTLDCDPHCRSGARFVLRLPLAARRG